MTTPFPAAHWHEGMFLRPQHFQASHRHHMAMIGRSARLLVHHCWGLHSIDLDADALKNYRLSVHSLEARMRDGTLVNVPADGALPAVDLKNALGRGGGCMVYLGIPVWKEGRPNVAGKQSADGEVRYTVETLELVDENTGRNPQRCQVRRLTLKTLLSGQDLDGYDTLPLLAIKRADTPDALLQLDESFIPPLLACDGWKPLHAGILQPIYDRLGKKVELLAGQVVSRGITFDSQSQGDRLVFEQLRVLNEAYARLGVQVFAQGMHPLPMYLELCELVGRLSIFSAERRPPQLPPYDHDDLATCFWRVRQYLDALLDIVTEPEYKERAFQGAGLRMQVALEPSWLEAGWRLFVGAQSTLPPEEIVELLTRAQDMKIGSSDRVDETYRLGLAGLRFSYLGDPPRTLPRRTGLVYFQIDRGSQQEEWDAVQRSLSLAVRLNESTIVGDIQGQRVLTMRVGGRTIPLQLTLFVVPRERI